MLQKAIFQKKYITLWEYKSIKSRIFGKHIMLALVMIGKVDVCSVLLARLLPKKSRQGLNEYFATRKALLSTTCCAQDDRR